MGNNKDTSVIPQGAYCYTYLEDGGYYVCPYWSKLKDGEEQADGYCAYLGMSDIDIGKAAFENDEVVITQDGKEVDKNDVPEFIFNGLLWDQCKECGINNEIKEEDYI